MALEERLRLIVDATTGTAEAAFGKLTTEAERTAKAADTAAESVASAADRVAQARNREADAAGKLSVAEAKLEEVRKRYGEGSSQLVAAEERVASAQRNVQLAARNTTQALEAQEAAQQQATATTERAAPAQEQAARGADRFREEVGGLRDTVVGLVAGVSLADWVSESVSGFLEGARGASSLAMSMNATTEQGGRFLAVAQQLGLEMDDLLEIQAEFAGQVAADDDLLSSFGARLVENADGTTNWALTLQDALGALQKVPDATERNALGFRVFGEEGYKQLSRLLLSGKSVEEAFAAMGTPFDDADVETARRFDEAMANLSSAAGGAGRELGSILVPVLTVAAEALGVVTDVVGILPGPVALATAGALALGLGMRFAAVEGGFLSGVLATMSGAATAAASRMIAATTSAAAFGAAAGAAGRASLALVGGPLGAALIGAGVAFHFASQGSDDLAESARDAAVDLAALEQSGDLAGKSANALGIATRRAANQAEEDAGYWERSAAYVRGYQEDLTGVEAAAAAVIEPFQRLTMGFGDTADTARGFELAIEEARAELGEFGVQQEVAKAAGEALTEMIAEGKTEGQGFADAVRAAAEAQATEAATSDLAEAALAAYNATTRDAAAAVRERIDATYAAEDAEFRFLDAMDAANAATDDGTTSVNEQRQAQVALMEAALAAADAAADAAIETREAAGDVLTDLDRANVRADEVLANLRTRLNTPGLSKGAREEMQGLIDQLATAQENGDIEAVLRLTGADETASDIDEAAKDRDTTVRVESRNGPAVTSYLDGIANANRLATIRVESRNGPAVDAYLDGLSVHRDRLAIIRVESRNGPAVDGYLDGLARDRLAIIRVETRGGPAVDAYLDSLAAPRTATINAARGAGLPAVGAGAYGAPSLGGVAGASRVMLGSVTLDLELTGTADRGQLSAAQRGRARVAEIKAYERENGTGWRESRR